MQCVGFGGGAGAAEPGRYRAGGVWGGNDVGQVGCAVAEQAAECAQTLGTFVRVMPGVEGEPARALGEAVLVLVEGLGADEGRPDFVAECFQVLCLALRKKPATSTLAPVVAGHPSMRAAVACACLALGETTTPRAACWSLLFLQAVFQWPQQSGPVLAPVLPEVLSAVCRFLLSAPAAAETPVLEAAARFLREGYGVLGARFLKGLEEALQPLPLGADEREALPLAVGDGYLAVEGLGELLRDTVEAWQVEWRRSLYR
mmetsp:Transcript_50302/g.114308  ORF Transcript_50302/g.114308 Transcript_50302/m.114308 type:complete len:259 (-) Transcript_50302:513-1289(-)